MILEERGETPDINRSEGDLSYRPLYPRSLFPRVSRKVPTIFGQIDLHPGDGAPRIREYACARFKSEGSLKVFRRKTQPFLIFSMQPRLAVVAFDTLY